MIEHPEARRQKQDSEPKSKDSEAQSKSWILIAILLIYIALVGCVCLCAIFGAAYLSTNSGHTASQPTPVQSGPCGIPGLSIEEGANCGSHTYRETSILVEQSGPDSVGCHGLDYVATVTRTFKFLSTDTMFAYLFVSDNPNDNTYGLVSRNTWKVTFNSPNSPTDFTTSIVTFFEYGVHEVIDSSTDVLGPSKCKWVTDYTLVK